MISFFSALRWLPFCARCVKVSAHLALPATAQTSPNWQKDHYGTRLYSADTSVQNQQSIKIRVGMKLARRTAAGTIGMLATVLLHSLFLAVAIWNGGSSKVARLPDAVGAGANTGRPDGASSERMIIIQLSSDSNVQSESPSSSQLISQPQKPFMLQVTGPDAIPLPPLEFEEEGEATQATDADLIARTKLAGLYESQIRARIERAWTQPNEPIRSLIYSCRVKVRQKRDGQVENVSLENCEGSFEWLNSLVNAIHSASPLPGAPHPGVFAYTFTMQFKSIKAQPPRAQQQKIHGAH